MRFAGRVEKRGSHDADFWRARTRGIALQARCAAFAGTASADVALPYQVAGDVAESFPLLTTTYYNPVDPQVLLAAASDARRSGGEKARRDDSRRRSCSVQPTATQPSPRSTKRSQAPRKRRTHRPATSPTRRSWRWPRPSTIATRSSSRRRSSRRSTRRSTRRRIGGIGVMIEPDAVIAIAFACRTCCPARPPNAPGLQVGDVIAAVDGLSTKGMNVETVSSHLRGKPGTVVVVTVLRAGAAPCRPRRFRSRAKTCSRRRSSSECCPAISATCGSWRSAKRTPGEFDTAIARLTEQGAKALVLDLRNDGGGYVNSALDISSRFIANKALLTVEAARPERRDDRRRQHDPSINAAGDACS